MEDDKKRKKIIVKETPENANWMHPQTPERLKMIEERYAKIRKEIEERNKRT